PRDQELHTPWTEPARCPEIPDSHVNVNNSPLDYVFQTVSQFFVKVAGTWPFCSHISIYKLSQILRDVCAEKF
ncbi:unnamed protein product, partial [Gulo gulo]